MLIRSFPAAPSSPVTRLPAASVPGHAGMGGLFDAILGIGGGIIQGIFGSKEAKAQRGLQRDMAQLEYGFRNRELDISKELAESQIAAVDRALDMQVQISQDKLRAELQAVRDQNRTVLDAQQAQARAQSAALSAEMASQTQRGIFSLASGSMAETGATTRTYPTVGTQAIAVIAVGVVLAIALGDRKGKSRKSVRKSRTKVSIGGAA